MGKNIVKAVKEIGVDVGNDALKLCMNGTTFDGKEKLEIMNVVAPGYNRRILGGIEKGQLVNLLDVTISKDGVPFDIGRYFVGGLAFKENRGDLIEKSKRDIKAKSVQTIVLMVTGIAYSLYDPQEPVKTENVAIGTLLPTEEFFCTSEDLVSELEKELTGSYTIKFNSNAFKGAEITINIVDKEIQPEGAAGHLAAIYNMDGSVKDDIEVENEVQLGIFIGSITTEVSVYNNGTFDARGMFGLNLGTAEPLDKIIGDLDLDLTRHQVDHFILTKKPFIVNVNGERLDYTERLNKFAENRYKIFVRQLCNEINKKLNKQGINMELITRVNLGGGGAIATFDAFKDEFRAGNVHLINDARFANARGSLYAIADKRKQENANDEVFDETTV